MTAICVGEDTSPSVMLCRAYQILRLRVVRNKAILMTDVQC
jgi:hypothetical protein